MAGHGTTTIAIHSDRATLAVTGEDRGQWLQGLVTCDLSDLSAGHGRWGLFLAKVGKIISDATIVVRDESLIVGVPASRLAVLLEHLDDFLVMEDAEVEEVPGMGWLTLFGDAAGQEAAAVVAAGPGFHRAAISWGERAGVVLVGPESERDAVVADLTSRGAEALSGEALQAFRIRSFMPVFGLDFGERQSPHDASIERLAVSWDKGCYLGQEAVCMLDMRGKVKRRLVSLTLSGAPPAGGAEVTSDDGVVGEVTSAARDAAGTVAFARVKASVAEPGTRLRVDGIEATVLEGPPTA